MFVDKFVCGNLCVINQFIAHEINPKNQFYSKIVKNINKYMQSFISESLIRCPKIINQHGFTKGSEYKL